MHDLSYDQSLPNLPYPAGDKCASGACKSKFDGPACSGGTCQSGDCTPAPTPGVCVQPSNVCQVNVSDAGVCTIQNQDGPCDDGNACTIGKGLSRPARGATSSLTVSAGISVLLQPSTLFVALYDDGHSTNQWSTDAVLQHSKGLQGFHAAILST